MSGPSVWDDMSKVEQLVKLWRDGVSATLCGRHLGVTRNAIIGKLHRLREKHGAEYVAPRVGKKPTPTGWQAQRKPRAKSKTILKQTACNSYVLIKANELKQRVSADVWPGAIDASEPVALLDLEPHHCRWPVDGEGKHTRFCGAVKTDNSSYCKHHADISTYRGEDK